MTRKCTRRANLSVGGGGKDQRAENGGVSTSRQNMPLRGR